MNGVACAGSEDRLLSCRSGSTFTTRCGSRYCSCAHANDVGVRCAVQTGKYGIQEYLSYKLQFYFSFFFEIVLMEKSDWQVVIWPWKVVLRCATVEYGGQCVVICGEEEMPLLPAGN